MTPTIAKSDTIILPRKQFKKNIKTINNEIYRKSCDKVVYVRLDLNNIKGALGLVNSDTSWKVITS